MPNFNMNIRRVTKPGQEGALIERWSRLIGQSGPV